MKKITLTMQMLCITIALIAQFPQAFNYQMVVRDVNGEIVSNQNIGIRISIHDDIPGGPIIYQEEYNIFTNQFGLVNLEIGNGTSTLGEFHTIDWGSGAKFLQVEIDLSGGTDYITMGTSQMLAVPYALYAQSTGDTTKWIKNSNNNLYFNGGHVGIGTDAPASFAKLDVNGNVNISGRAIISKSDETESILNMWNSQSDWEIATASDADRLMIRQWEGEPIFTASGDGIGIGTTNPVARLTIVGKDSARMVISSSNTLNSLASGIMFKGTFGSDIPDLEPRNLGMIKAHFDGGGWETASLSFHVAGVDCHTDEDTDPCERMRVTSDGYVGIGTTTPFAKLDVRGSSTDDGAIITTGNSNSSHMLTFFPGRENDPNPFIQWKAGDPLRFSTDEGGWSEKMRINSNGKVAIGTDEPEESALLDLNSKSEGFLPPRMSDVERDAISNPVAGLVLWCNNCGALGELQVYNGTAWVNMVGAAAANFECGISKITDDDGNIYSTDLIGSQCWMSENLNVGNRIDGSEEMADNNIIEKYCYENLENNCVVFGGLYQWDEIMQYETIQGLQGICPAGWHIPADEEWKQLEGYADTQYNYPDPEWDGADLWRGFNAGLHLKSTVGWNSGGDGTNLYGFWALPGGYRSSDGFFQAVYSSCKWWSSTETSVGKAWQRGFISAQNSSYRGDAYKTAGFSVRCLRD